MKKILALSILLLLLIPSIASATSNTSFHWAGHFYGDNPPSRGYPCSGWIEGDWNINIDAKLEAAPYLPDFPIVRLYSINSVSFEIPFQYYTEKQIGTGNSSLCEQPLSENFAVTLGASNFDLSFNLDEMGSSTMYNYSWIIENEGAPAPGDYSCQIFLKYDEQNSYITPQGSTLSSAEVSPV